MFGWVFGRLVILEKGINKRSDQLGILRSDKAKCNTLNGLRLPKMYKLHFRKFQVAAITPLWAVCPAKGIGFCHPEESHDPTTDEER